MSLVRLRIRFIGLFPLATVKNLIISGYVNPDPAEEKVYELAWAEARLRYNPRRNADLNVKDVNTIPCLASASP